MNEEHDELGVGTVKFVDADLPRPNLAEEDVYGGGGGEDFRSRREYDGDEVEAVKLFLTGDDGVAAVLGFGSSSEGVRSSGVKEVRTAIGVFIATVKNCSFEDLGRTCPWPFSF